LKCSVAILALVGVTIAFDLPQAFATGYGHENGGKGESGESGEGGETGAPEAPQAPEAPAANADTGGEWPRSKIKDVPDCDIIFQFSPWKFNIICPKD